MSTQAPSAPHAWQAPHETWPQQTPSVQKPLAHSPAAVQAEPGNFSPQVPLLQNWPVTHCVSKVQAAHAMPPQKPLWQSSATLQSFLSAHDGHDPPQSTSVSSPSFTPSVHVGSWQRPSAPQAPLKQSVPTMQWAPSGPGP
jgi:hypothetical protein